MRVLSATEIQVLVGELQKLVGFYIEKVYEVGENRFRIKVKKDKEQANIQVILSHAINRTSYVERMEQPSDFTMAVRKRVGGFRIDSIMQVNDDRIVIMELRKEKTERDMILEMFGAGNLIITDSSMKIELAYRQRQFSDRKVANGMEYKAPMQKQGYKLEMPDAVNPCVFIDEKGRAVDYSATGIEKYQGLEKKEAGSLQEALDLFYYDNPMGQQEIKESALEKQLRLSIEKQRRLMKSAESDIEANKEMAEKIFDNMNRINMIIDELRKSKRITREELQGHAEGMRIMDLDLRDKKVTIEID